LEELRAPSNGPQPEDAPVREPLAMGLFLALTDAKEANELTRRDALFEELRGLQRAHPEDAAVREWLVKGLFSTLTDAKQENGLQRRDDLLVELRELRQRWPEDHFLRDLFCVVSTTSCHTWQATRDSKLRNKRNMCFENDRDRVNRSLYGAKNA
jgi:hypothetical protein